MNEGRLRACGMLCGGVGHGGGDGGLYIPGSFPWQCGLLRRVEVGRSYLRCTCSCVQADEGRL